MSNVKSVRFIPTLLVAFLLLGAAGCGDTEDVGGAASAVPESAAVYVSVDTSFEGDQWRAVSDLVAKFPDGEGALEELLDKATAEAGLEGNVELRDALGPEVALAVLDGPMGPEGEPPVVMLTQPDDQDAFEQLLEQGDEAHAEVRGWQVVAQDEAVLDRYREALEGASLEVSDAFAQAMDDLPEGALARLYANGESLAKVVPEFQTGLQQAPFGLMASDAGFVVGAALRAEGNGVRVEGRMVPTGDGDLLEAEPYDSELVEEVPAGAIAFFSVDNVGRALSEYGGMFGGGAGLLPFDLDEVGALLSGETAFYMRPGPEPTVTLVTQVEDEAAALRTVDALVGLAGKKANIVYDAFDGLLAVSSSERELAALRGDGPRLDQDDRFEQALEAAGMPDQTTGFGYVDVKAAVPLFLGLGAPQGLGAAALDAYLDPVGGAVFWGESSGEAQRFSLFLGID
jgi:hypothetical protein